MCAEGQAGVKSSSCPLEAELLSLWAGLGWGGTFLLLVQWEKEGKRKMWFQIYLSKMPLCKSWLDKTKTGPESRNHQLVIS